MLQIIEFAILVIIIEKTKVKTYFIDDICFLWSYLGLKIANGITISSKDTPPC